MNEDQQDRIEDPVDFGYRAVPRAEKPGLVRGVFSSVAGRYDLMNDLMSLGVHRLRKQSFVAALRQRPGEALVDVAGGTGDIARAVADAVGFEAAGPITLIDLTPEMLAAGRDRSLDSGYARAPLAWVAGDALALPLAARSQDAYTIAFGLRNVADIDAALAEAHRVLKPGGRFFCLEFSQVTEESLARLYDLYSFQVLPRLGRVVAGDAEAYRYLVESIRRFPDQESLAARMTAAGFSRVRFRNLTGGVAAIHSGWRL